jgi:hypothetical protein
VDFSGDKSLNFSDFQIMVSESFGSKKGDARRRVRVPKTKRVAVLTFAASERLDWAKRVAGGDDEAAPAPGVVSRASLMVCIQTSYRRFNFALLCLQAIEIAASTLLEICKMLAKYLQAAPSAHRLEG